MLKFLGLVLLIYLVWQLLVRPLLDLSQSSRDRWPRSPNRRKTPGARGGKYVDYEDVE